MTAPATLRIPLAVAVVLLPALSCRAGVVEYTDRQAWFDAVDEVVTTIGFTEYAEGTTVTGQYADLGVLFPDGDDGIVDDESLFPNDGKGIRSFEGTTIAFTTPQPQTSIALEFRNLTLFSLYAGGELVHSAYSGVPGSGNFFGVISTEPFDTVEVLSLVPVTDIDDLHYVAGPLTPCPGKSACEAAKVIAPDGANSDYLGWSVAVRNDVLVAGAPRDDLGLFTVNSGSAYVFRRDDSSGWTFDQKLFHLESATSDQLGYAVAVAGDVLAVAAPFHDEGATNAGAVYVYRETGNVWTFEQKLLAPDAGAYDDLGWALAVEPGPPPRIVASAAFDDDNGFDSGSVYVFRFDDGPGWTLEQKLLAADGAAHDNFGISVAVDAGPPRRIAAGAYNDNDNGFDSGSAYVFRFDEETSQWQQEQKLLAADGELDDQFGAAVGISGDAVLVGAAWDDDNGDRSGSAYVFRLGGAASQWRQEQKLLPIDGQAEDKFGVSVALSGPTAVIGAYHDDDNSVNAGAVYLYDSEETGWVQRQKLLASGDVANDHFGGAVAAWRQGESLRIGVGAYLARPNSIAFAGAAWVFNQAPGPGDVNCDGILGIDEFLSMLGSWGPCADQENCPPDLDCDGVVGVDDMLMLFANWGP